MKTYICISIFFLSLTAGANPFDELTGDAARARTAEARAKADSLRAATAAALNEINQKRALIESTKNQIAADQEKLKAWTHETRIFVEAEIAGLPEKTRQTGLLAESLKNQATLVAQIRKSFSQYAQSAVKYSDAAKSAWQLNQLARRSDLSAGEIFMAYLSALKEIDLYQAGSLSALAWQKGPEALYSTEPVIQHLEATLSHFIQRVDAESVVETLTIIKALDEGLQVQVMRATKLHEGANSLGQVFMEVRDGLNQQGVVP
jgi:hypothetical protein